MQVSPSQSHLIARILYQSMSQDVMIRAVRQLWPDYDLHRQSGIRDMIPIPLQDGAHQIVRDMTESGLFIDFVEVLLKIDSEGIMGRKYPIHGAPELIKLLKEKGFVYDRVNNAFLEDPRTRCSPDWGRLKEGGEYNLALLRMDMVNNSRLVRNHPRELVDQAFESLRMLIKSSVERRLGRIWQWEGDGATAAFFYGHRQVLGVYTGMEILQNLWLYNHFRNPLGKPLELRLALHSGYMRFSTNSEVLRKSDVLKKAMETEASHTPPDHLVITSQVENALEKPLARLFQPHPQIHGLFTYTLEVSP